MDTTGMTLPPKQCTGCGRTKPVTDFHFRSRAKGVRHARCKDCITTEQKERYCVRVAARTQTAVRSYAEMWGKDGRRCTGCLEWKSWGDFGKKKSGHNGYSARCRLCNNRAARSSRRVNVDGSRRAERQRADRTGANYKARYGITREKFEEIARAQLGACVICGNDEKRLVVDHDHRTGKRRDLLCDRCNRDVGAVEDPVRLRALVGYLARHGSDVQWVT